MGLVSKYRTGDGAKRYNTQDWTSCRPAEAKVLRR